MCLCMCLCACVSVYGWWLCLRCAVVVCMCVYCVVVVCVPMRIGWRLRCLVVKVVYVDWRVSLGLYMCVCLKYMFYY